MHEIKKNPWKPLVWISFDEVNEMVIQVKYVDEMGIFATENVDYCLALFDNGKEYKLVAPWFNGPGLLIQKSNNKKCLPTKIKRPENFDDIIKRYQ